MDLWFVKFIVFVIIYMYFKFRFLMYGFIEVVDVWMMKMRKFNWWFVYMN